MMRRALLLAAVFWAMPALSTAPAEAPLPALAARAPGCGDLLAATGRKPPHLVFVGCTFRPDRQGKPLRASYRVPGAQGAAVEAWFVRRAGMAPLKRSCCQWDGPAGHLRDRAGRDMTVTMASPETAVSSRACWSRIPAFEVIVETFTEEI